MKPNPYTILQQLKATAGLHHYFIETQITEPQGEPWIISGQQFPNGPSAMVTHTNFQCTRLEFFIKRLHVNPNILIGVLPMINALDNSCEGELKLIPNIPDTLTISYSIHLPVGFNEAHLHLVTNDLTGTIAKLNSLHSTIKSMMNSRPPSNSNRMNNSSYQSPFTDSTEVREMGSEFSLNSNIWESISETNLGKPSSPSIPEEQAEDILKNLDEVNKEPNSQKENELNSENKDNIEEERPDESSN